MIPPYKKSAAISHGRARKQNTGDSDAPNKKGHEQLIQPAHGLVWQEMTTSPLEAPPTGNKAGQINANEGCFASVVHTTASFPEMNLMQNDNIAIIGKNQALSKAGVRYVARRRLAGCS